MQLLPPFVFILILLISFGVSSAVDCRNGNAGSKVAYTITVNKFGKYNTIQAAIDSISPNNVQWVKVFIFPGIYIEKVTIPPDKQCIFLEGKGRHLTIITHDDHEQTDESAAFTSCADNVIVKGITFKNSFNRPVALDFYKNRMEAGVFVTQALAARIYGDKTAFYGCGFLGFQDTLWDATGRHHFNNSYIEGGIDFIWGGGQSIYENCQINVTVGTTLLPQGYVGYITAQYRNSSDDPSGFVFRGGSVFGTGQVFLGRAYGPYSRVIFRETMLYDVVAPEGWLAWNYRGQEDKFTYAEVNCRGPGSNTSKRVKWMKKLRPPELNQFSTSSFINQDGWLDRLPW